MRTIKDGDFEYGICDFCDQSEKADIGDVYVLGKKGICDICLGALAHLLVKAGIVNGKI